MSKSILAYITKLLVTTSVLSFLVLPAIGCNQEKPGEITFQQLFSNPNQYNGKEIIIEGFYFQGFEVQVIAEGLDYSGYAEGHLVPKDEMIWVEGEIPFEIYNRLYWQQMMGPEERYGKIRLEGTFEYGRKYGHVGGYNSQIIPSKVELLEWSPQAIIPIKDFSQEESQQIAKEFVRNSPTFIFDGIEETLKLTETYPPTVTLSGWQFAFEFDSRHAGYGDRTEQIFAQVITPHQAVIVVEQGKITHAVMDDKWNMIQQQEIK